MHCNINIKKLCLFSSWIWGRKSKKNWGGGERIKNLELYTPLTFSLMNYIWSSLRFIFFLIYLMIYDVLILLWYETSSKTVDLYQTKETEIYIYYSAKVFTLKFVNVWENLIFQLVVNLFNFRSLISFLNKKF